jgi:4-diphosphocytidyl-2-C-methyl-D-erythritol kinase
MISFPNAKINIGLNIVARRADGYHELETLFFPIGWKDALEFIENGTGKVTFANSGLAIDAPAEQNIVVKAYRLLAADFDLPGIDIHLHKAIPFGAGLGGGSADAAFMLKMLNSHFELQLNPVQLKSYALKLGADCFFFIDNRPSFASGIGEKLEPFLPSLKGIHLLLVKPPVGVGTKEAYARVVPHKPQHDLKTVLSDDVSMWKNRVVNDFEASVFLQFPVIGQIKDEIYRAGACYASMSGSGSSVFGFFHEKPNMARLNLPEGSVVWEERLDGE